MARDRRAIAARNADTTRWVLFWVRRALQHDPEEGMDFWGPVGLPVPCRWRNAPRGEPMDRNADHLLIEVDARYARAMRDAGAVVDPADVPRRHRLSVELARIPLPAKRRPWSPQAVAALAERIDAEYPDSADADQRRELADLLTHLVRRDLQMPVAEAVVDARALERDVPDLRERMAAVRSRKRGWA